MYELILRLFRSERGEIGDEETQTDNTELAPETDTGTGETEVVAPETQETGTEVVADQTQDQRDDFLASEGNLDPRKLDPALQPIFKRMQGVYTKRMQEIRNIRDRAEQVDRFYNDAQFAQQTLTQWAAKNGYQLTPTNGQSQAPGAQAQKPGEAPAAMVEAFKAKLDPQLQWMAQPQADALWAAMSGMLEPVLQKQQAESRKQQEQEWDKHAASLNEVAPGWEEHEEAMGDLHDFLKSPALFHPTYGSKIQMLYDLATARAASLKQAQARVANAGKNRVTSGRPVTSSKPSIEDEILKASTKDAWALAKRAALSQHKKSA